jgi:hypothetical protein
VSEPNNPPIPPIPPPNDEAKPKANAFKSIRFVIEFGDGRNRNFVWPLDNSELRGAFNKSGMLPYEHNEYTDALPNYVPGSRIEFDGERRQVRIFDGLSSTPEVFDVIKAQMKEVFMRNVGERPEVKRSDLSDTMMKSICYWARRFLMGSPAIPEQGPRQGGPQAKVITGEVPELRQIARLPGKTMVENFNSSSVATKYIEDRDESGQGKRN